MRSITNTRITGARLAWCAALAGAMSMAGCSGSGQVPGGADVDPAIALFVSGRYDEAARRLGELARTVESAETLREVYYYLGRSYLALGETDRAIEAFSAGVSYGDTGGCLDYLEDLRAFVETRPESLRRSEGVSRRQLASGLAELAGIAGFGGPAPGDSTGAASASEVDADFVLRRVVERGWMAAMPDGGLHGDEPVTRAALYVILSRVVAELGADQALLSEYRTSFAERGAETVGGAEVTGLLSAISNSRK